ncbi:MAG TPA: formyltransferase family protein [Blastocatellia bacterium]|nr:formyltransferase family protein [Blastocatellia bacterium]
MSQHVFRRNGNETGVAVGMRTALICHEGAPLDREGLARWLASFSNLVGVVVLRETNQRMQRRVRREIKRVGVMRFMDVIAFRLYYRLFLAGKDRQWQKRKLDQLRSIYPEVNGVPVLYTHSPNSAEAEAFIRRISPDILLARCKTLLKESVFSLPSKGTFVMHPGICPEYRNAHGCFWALANGDLNKVGMTLLRIDKGVDTGPVYGYYDYDYDEAKESHVVIQHRVVLENLDKLEKKFMEIYTGQAAPLDTTGRASATWGQPWLSSYLKWKRRARRGNQ